MAEFKPFELIIRAESDSKGTAVELKYVQELVRCDECEHYDGQICCNPTFSYGAAVPDDWFCAGGKRKGQE